ncbi:WYL domain-containing transcriptional regulator [Dehalogenimonas sp. THU2]|uniref:helix-turn-helix transcriptional regulator n=1 Tax=Dehalogenimonas sp. THU2 TaxID=3151121 RepID=UPI003218BDD4
MTSINRQDNRLVRLAAIEHLLYQSGEKGLRLDELADYLDVSSRTVRRDLDAIEAQQVFPMWREGAQCGIVKGKYLPPIHFTLPEALNLFLATRLMLSYANRHDPDVVGIFSKLNCAMPSPFKEQIQSTLKWIRTLPDNPRLASTLSHLAGAWARQKRVRISYRAIEAETAGERVIETYFIQPAAPGHSAYVIGYCQKAKAMRTFKVERIENIFELDETYEVPADFDANRYLADVFGVTVGGEVMKVRLKSRTQEAARLLSETMWHSSQENEAREDGAVIAGFEVVVSNEFVSWVLGWGDRVEVLEPEGLRESVKSTAEAMAGVYG